MVKVGVAASEAMEFLGGIRVCCCPELSNLSSSFVLSSRGKRGARSPKPAAGRNSGKCPGQRFGSFFYSLWSSTAFLPSLSSCLCLPSVPRDGQRTNRSEPCGVITTMGWRLWAPLLTSFFGEKFGKLVRPGPQKPPLPTPSPNPSSHSNELRTSLSQRGGSLITERVSQWDVISGFGRWIPR